MGTAVILSGKEEVQGKADMKNWFMNVVARFQLFNPKYLWKIFTLHYSDKISLDRSLPDVRLEECKAIVYDYKALPKASVVIICKPIYFLF
jgi:hypothetical protein